VLFRSVEVIKANLQTCGLGARAEVRRGDAFAMLATTPERSFDYVYIAPPQYKEMWSKALLLVDQNPAWLNEGAWVIVQIDPREAQELTLTHLEQFDERRYGSTLLVFYEKTR
jgi:16S rRNA (guanine966-N2)-methyltransferase